jgi:uncharacterized membrane-anchored protein
MKSLPQQFPKKRYFWFALAVQFLLMATVPAQAIYTQLTGQSIILKTIPVDPYDPMRGYSTTLRYDISEVKLLKTLPGWQDMPTIEDPYPDYSKPKGSKTPKPRILKPGTTIYVTLEQDLKAAPSALRPWKATAISSKLSPQRSPEKVILKGVVPAGNFGNFQFVDYGLETYYMPENRRNEVNDAIRSQKAVAEIKVDAQGQGVPLKLRVGDRDFEF